MTSPFGDWRAYTTLADQDDAITGLRHAYVEASRQNPAKWQNFDAAIEVAVVHATNGIEGSTLTESETAAVLRSGVAHGAIPFRDFAAAIGDLEALREARRLGATKLDLSAEDITRLIELLQQSSRPRVLSQFGPPSVEQKAKTVILARPEIAVEAEWCAWVLQGRSNVREAFEAHYDVVARPHVGRRSGRWARLLLNFLLMRKGLPPLIIGKNWHLEFHERTTVRLPEEDRTAGTKSPYQHFMGARLLQTLEYALALG